jgi:DNA-binding transcriptional MocR family regulator
MARAGDPVLFATPCYAGALAVARSAGLVPVSVPTDENGVRPELADRAFAQTGARVMYLQPTYANPDGSVLAASRRAELLDIAHRHGAVLVEDDFARWLGHGDPVPAPLLTDDRHGHVVTICSLTKAAAPSMRVGAVIARGPVAARITDMRTVDDFFVSAPLQYAAVELVSSPSWKTHLRQLAAGLAGRRVALGSALAAALPEGCRPTSPRGGVSIWLQLPPGVSDVDVAREAALRRLFVHPGRFYTLVTPPKAHLRLSFAALPESDAPEAVNRLVAAIEAAGTHAVVS